MNRLDTNDRRPDPAELEAMNEALTEPLNLITHGIEGIMEKLSGLGDLRVSDSQKLEAADAWLRNGLVRIFHEARYARREK